MTEISSMIITHSKASITDIENAWHGTVEDLLRRLHSNELVYECVVLMTCNRVEVYVVSPKGSKVLFEYAKKMGVPERILEFNDHEESLVHLMRVACGLESMIVGEDQILGQVKDLYHVARDTGVTGKVLDTAFDKVTHVGKRVRSETRINKGSVSIGSAAIDLAEDVLETLSGKTVVVIGAGTMGSLVAHALAHKDVSAIYVANRTIERAEELAEELNGIAVQYDDRDQYIARSDVVISATSAPHAVLTAEMLQQITEGRDKDLLLIDIATPRDIEERVSDLPNVLLYNIDGLKKISDKNLQKRMHEVARVEKIIEEEYELLKLQYKRQRADKIIASLYNQIEGLRIRERERAINRLSATHTLGDFERSVLDDLTHAITNKVLAEPTKTLRNAAAEDDIDFLDATAALFKLDKKRY
ncbi:MAG: glutamyl-tRNA reductase [Desulfuromonadales bacterium C00003094]|jgi:glutamyl-tRNA reductase|nr:MAG: glutamyl-tRNA reductase [Desulfuromonadales bacterium C00003094]